MAVVVWWIMLRAIWLDSMIWTASGTHVVKGDGSPSWTRCSDAVVRVKRIPSGQYRPEVVDDARFASYCQNAPKGPVHSAATRPWGVLAGIDLNEIAKMRLGSGHALVRSRKSARCANISVLPPGLAVSARLRSISLVAASAFGQGKDRQREIHCSTRISLGRSVSYSWQKCAAIS